MELLLKINVIAMFAALISEMCRLTLPYAVNTGPLCTPFTWPGLADSNPAQSLSKHDGLIEIAIAFNAAFPSEGSIPQSGLIAGSAAVFRWLNAANQALLALMHNWLAALNSTGAGPFAASTTLPHLLRPRGAGDVRIFQGYLY